MDGLILLVFIAALAAFDGRDYVAR